MWSIYRFHSFILFVNILGDAINNFSSMKMSRQTAFTLIELLIVIAIIGILAAAIFVAIDPARRLHEARNARRSSDIATLLEAVKKYQADADGTHYSVVAGLTAGTNYVIGTCSSGASCTAVANDPACADLSNIGAAYLETVAMDPNAGTAVDTDYYITRDTNNEITVGSCEPEGEGANGAGIPPIIAVQG